MSNDVSSPGGQPISQAPAPQSVYQDPRAQRRAERAARRAERRLQGPSWVGGGILILLGVIFLLQNFGVVYAFNWWALFILIPAIGAFGAAWNTYTRTGHFGAAARGSFIGGIVLTMIAAAFLFDLNLELVFPVILILAGFGILLNMLLPN